MSEADKLFEELGYKKFDNHPEEDEQKIEPNKWITQDCRVIEYTQSDTINGEFYTLYIRFHMQGKRVEIGANKAPKEIRTMSLRLPAVFDAKEIEAINEKIKELGWLDE